jgi:flagellar motor switch protein FliN/FliY
VAGSRAANLAWLLKEFSDRLASVFETMAGERPSTAHAPGHAPADAGPGGLLWRQLFAGVPGPLWISSPESDWTLSARQILHAAGMEDADRETLESTYIETLGQALGGLAQSISLRLGREITPAAGEKAGNVEGEVGWLALELTFAGGVATLYAGTDAQFIDALTAAVGGDEVVEREPPEAGAEGASKTFDLLLDVEMPVSVSFGRAKVPLKDVLKLTTGSIVELNRSLIEPVEVIVNNCVIARGEVVVVEGNFGVRIQQVVSRRERLRTLY